MRGVCVSLDLETTGLDVSSSHIIEIGAVKFKGHEVIGTYTTLVDPGTPIPAKITAITGIHQDKMRGAPKLPEVLPKLKQFVEDAPIVGHNIDFDLSFLHKQGILKGSVAIDTYEMASVLLPTTPRYNLNALMQQLNLSPDGEYHRALADAQATMQVYAALWDRLLTDVPLDLLREIVTAAGKLSWRGLPAFADALAAREGESPQPMAAATASPMIQTARVPEPPLERASTIQPLDCDDLAGKLSPGGQVAEAIPNYQPHSQQIEMLQAVCTALNGSEHLIVEAMPGTGRSLAYLLPAVTWAIQNGERVVVSVNTTSLQNQLLNREIPLLAQALGTPVNATVLKSRRSYFCPRRIETLRRRLPTSIEELRVYAKIQVWRSLGLPGDGTEISLRGPAEYGTWARLSAQDEECTLERCELRMGGICPFYQAHRAAESAHVILVNHSLLVADALSLDRQVLPDYRYLIVDEAHNLEEAITDSLSFRLDATAIKRQLADLGTKKTGLLGDILVSTKPVLPEKFYDQIRGFVSIITSAVSQMGHHVDSLFAVILDFLQTTNHLRPGEYITQIRLSDDLRNKPAFSQVKAAWSILSEFTMAIADAFAKLSASLPTLRGRYEVPHLDDLIDGVQAASSHLGLMHAQLDAFIGEPQGNTIYWIEVAQNLDSLSIHGAPLHAGPLVKKYLWDDKKTVIMASATLRANSSFRYVRQRLSAENVRELALTSPFDYQKSTLVYLPVDMPEPQDRNLYQQFVERGIIELAAATEGRLMVLFTGYTQLRQVAQNIAPRLALGNILVLDQSDGTSREQLLEGFRSAEKAVLLGTRSFWEDIDLSGDDLVALVIVRLPFAVPSDPVYAARGETFENSFDEYTVPDAILRFRQGFDRLIRARTDRGVVAIFDRRMVSKSYGLSFLESLPVCTIRKAPMADMSAAAKEWLNEPIESQDEPG